MGSQGAVSQSVSQADFELIAYVIQASPNSKSSGLNL